MNQKQVAIILLITILFSIGVALIIYSNYSIYEVDTVTMDLNIRETKGIGVNKDSDALHFGSVPKKSTVERFMIITNNFDKEVEINIKKYGELSKYVKIESESFKLMPKEKNNITFTAYAKEELDYGNYSGTVKIFFLRP